MAKKSTQDYPLLLEI